MVSWNPFDRIESKLDQVIAQQARIYALLTKQGALAMGLKEDVDNLVAEVEENTTVVGSVQTLLTQLTSMLTSLKDQIADPAAQAALQQAITTLDANNKAIAAAVTANTPNVVNPLGGGG